MKQLSLIPTSRKSNKEHGGSLLLGKRRSRRPLTLKAPLHLVLRSDFAYGHRSLVRHRPLIDRILTKAAKRFQIRIYEKGVVSNHIHLAIRGKSRFELQNFFRVVAGHLAQEILKQFPLLPGEKPKAGGASKNMKGPLREKENKFWQTRVYSRIVSWGREYLAVRAYVLKNHLKGLGLIPYIRGSPLLTNTRTKNTS